MNSFPIRRALAAVVAGGGLVAAALPAAVLAAAPIVQWSPASTNFGNQAVGTTSAPATETLSAVPSHSVTVSQIALSGTNANQFQIVSDGCTGMSLNGSKSCNVTVSFAPTAIQADSASLCAIYSGPSSPTCAGLAGNAVGQTASVSPNPFDYGRVVQGDTTPAQEFDLTNTSSTGVAITVNSGGVTLSGPNASDFAIVADSCSGQTVAAGSHCAVEVTFTPSTQAAESATLNFADSASGSPQTAALAGTGAAPPAITIAPNPVNFGNITVNTTSAADEVVLSNPSTNTVPVHVLGISTSDPQFGISSDFCSNNYIGPGGSCLVRVTFTPSSTGTQTATLNFADDAAGNPQHVNLTGVGSNNTYFYFAEGTTRSGFSEELHLLMPSQNGTATITYFVNGQTTPVVEAPINLTAGQPVIRNVTSDVGAGNDVSAQVVFDHPAVAERIMHFGAGTPWHGSTDKTGVQSASNSWYFAEGSTLNVFNEYVTLQNPNSSAAHATLSWQTDTHGAAVHFLTIPANSRVTVLAWMGSLTSDNNPANSCDPLNTCGVGGGITGVSLHVSADEAVVAERPMYVVGNSWGSGKIYDGHDAFGSNAPASAWYFAEGTTLGGFNEFLTLQNPNSSAVTATLTYNTQGIADTTPFTRTVQIPANSRQTVLVYNGDHTAAGQNVSNCNPQTTCGVGPGVTGVSTVVTADAPIVAERPMYMYYPFQPGVITAGATVVAGAEGPGTSFGFAGLTVASGEYDYITIQNPGGTDATVTLTYYGCTGGPVQKTANVAAGTRSTVLVFDSTVAGGLGRLASCTGSQAPGGLGVVVTSTQPVVVEKPTYSANSSTYGATDTMGYDSSF